MEFLDYGMFMKYRMSCEDDDRRNEKANHAGYIRPDDRGSGYYWLEGRKIPAAVRASYIEPIAKKFEKHGHLESIIESVNSVPHIPGAEAVSVDITFYIKGRINGSPRLQTKFHVFKVWDKDGNETIKEMVV